MDIIAPMLNTSLTFIKILNMYINGKMRILMATIATKTPFFPNNITGKDAIHVIKIELSVISDHVRVPEIATSHIQHTRIPIAMVIVYIIDIIVFLFILFSSFRFNSMRFSLTFSS